MPAPTKLAITGRRGTWELHELIYEAIEKHRERMTIVPLDALPHKIHLPKSSGSDLKKKAPAILEVTIPEPVAKALRGQGSNGQPGQRPFIVLIEIPAAVMLDLTSPIIRP